MSGAHAGPLVRWLTVAIVYGLLIEIARRVALAAGAVSRPNPIVSAHRRPVPYLGGVGLVMGYAIALVWLVPGAAAATGPPLARLVTALALMTLGTWDDLSSLGPLPKLGVESLLCGGYLVATGEPWGARLVIEVVLMVMLVNAYNMIDVMDGLLCVAATAAFLGLLGAAGAVETIFSILAIRDNIAPPTINLENPSVETAIDLVPQAPRKREIDVALSNSFGFGGTNASVIVRRVSN